MIKKFETVIGLEVHAQLKTKSKMFCACSANFGDKENQNICPVCTGHPGTLPAVNKHAVELAIKTGLALNSEISKVTSFARKNYFYPDLTKGYQITQFDSPICTGGRLGGVSITRIQLEEDAGKSIHDRKDSDYSLMDYNRCSVPLIEIISGPDMRSPEEAVEYLKKLKNILRYLEVCDADMQKGNFRCDVNISIRPVGEKKLGTRTEMKNLNSFKAVEGALKFEIERQSKILGDNGNVLQETRLWNDAKSATESMRGKEEAHDYRYFPEPDLMFLKIDDELIEEIRKSLPELPEARAARFINAHGIPEYDALVLTSEKRLAEFYEETISHYNSPKKISNWIMTELMREMKTLDDDFSKCRVSPKHLADLVRLVDDGVISGKIGKDIFAEIFKTGKSPESIISEKGLKQISNNSELESIADEVIKDHPAQVLQYKNGKEALLGFFVGQMMKRCSGQANPKLANEIFKRKLS